MINNTFLNQYFLVAFKCHCAPWDDSPHMSILLLLSPFLVFGKVVYSLKG